MNYPDVHPVAIRLFESLGDGLTSEDEGLGWPLLHWIDAVVGETLGPLEDLYRDSDTRPGWGDLLDIDTAPPDAVAWLGQFSGARIPAGLLDAARREYVKDRHEWETGRRPKVIEEIVATLTGTKRFSLVERAGSPGNVELRTHPAETPDTDATEAAFLRQKPGGLTYEYEATDRLTIHMLRGRIDDLVGTIDGQSIVWETP